MSELNTTQKDQPDLRWHLLTTASALALLSGVLVAGDAIASETDQPTVWIELGGTLQRIGGAEERFTPDFTTTFADLPFNKVSPLTLQRLPRYGVDGDASLSISPHGSDWIFNISGRYGRSNASRELHQQAAYTKKQTNGRLPSDSKYVKLYVPYTHSNHTEVNAKEAHLVLDFKAGKDVGLGSSGGAAQSMLSLGIRYAQFSTKVNTQFYSVPFHYWPENFYQNSKNRVISNFAQSRIDRSFHGIGPTLSWEGNIRVAGTPDTNQLSADWGLNAAVLFGRQKVEGFHYSSARLIKGDPAFGGTMDVTGTAAPVNRSTKRIVPNLGGFAGVTFTSDNAKVSFGYRADFFFGAMDGGLDSRQTHDRSFHGPFAKASIGLGG